MKTALLTGEEIISQHSANLMRGLEGVGGRIYITNQRLIFESHSFNIQTGAEVIVLSSIIDTKKIWSRFLGIPLAPNGLKVTTQYGEYAFVVYGRTKIIDTINKYKSA